MKTKSKKTQARKPKATKRKLISKTELYYAFHVGLRKAVTRGGAAWDVVHCFAIPQSKLLLERLTTMLPKTIQIVDGNPTPEDANTVGVVGIDCLAGVLTNAGFLNAKEHGLGHSTRVDLWGDSPNMLEAQYKALCRVVGDTLEEMATDYEHGCAVARRDFLPPPHHPWAGLAWYLYV